jgi:hypothetical protein
MLDYLGDNLADSQFLPFRYQFMRWLVKVVDLRNRKRGLPF